MAPPKKSKGGRPSKAKLTIGKRFGKLTVLRFSRMTSSQSLLICICDCSPSIEREMPYKYVSQSKAAHCGCSPVYRSKSPPGHRAAVDAKWREENKEFLKKNYAEWSKKNWPALVKKKNAWKVANPKKVAVIAKRFREAHPERVAAWKTKRRAQLKGARIEDVKAIEAWEIAWRSKHSVRCYWCGGSFAPRKSHIDHIVALILGGAHSPDNVCIACSKCNLRKNRLAVAQWNALIAEPVLL